MPKDHPRVLEDQALLKIADDAAASNNQFVKVFEVLDSRFKDWRLLAFGLIFVVVGIVIFAFPKIWGSVPAEFESSFGMSEFVQRLKAATRRSVFSALARQEAVGTVKNCMCPSSE